MPNRKGRKPPRKSPYGRGYVGVQIRPETRDLLAARKGADESYDALILRVLRGRA